jgi:hypothetical protein
METAAKKVDWKRYDDARPKISVRIPKADKEALDAALQRRGESVSDLLMAYLRPIITEGVDRMEQGAAQWRIWRYEGRHGR